MISKRYFARSRFWFFGMLSLLLVFASCAPRGIAPSPGNVQRPVPTHPVPSGQPAEKPPAAPEDSGTGDPRMTASLQLTRQARSLIETRQPDSAIRLLERAVALDPANGQNYYYLSEAWLLKGNAKQAANFNELAAIHLGTRGNWHERIAEQRHRIKRRLQN